MMFVYGGEFSNTNQVRSLWPDSQLAQKTRVALLDRRRQLPLIALSLAPRAGLQTQFHHYRDFWRLDLVTNEWAKIDPKGRGPTARSGHRMAGVDGKIFLFGGFSDFVKESKYYNDMFVFDIEESHWSEIKFPLGVMVPSKRSGFQWVVDDKQILLFGGYCKEQKHKKGFDVNTDNRDKKIGTDEDSEYGKAPTRPI